MFLIFNSNSNSYLRKLSPNLFVLVLACHFISLFHIIFIILLLYESRPPDKDKLKA
jgi:hypothetical protein